MTEHPVQGLPIQVSSCWFLDGQHVYASPDCPHNERDEEPGEKPRGWTVQQ